MGPRGVRVVVAGPTASGKSVLALDLADRLTRGGLPGRVRPWDGPVGGRCGPDGSGTPGRTCDAVGPGQVEVVSADASQLYRGMDIGTAKLPADQRRGYPHHQIDVLHVTQEASVAAYQRHARGDMEAIESRGSRPLVVGGSGLYLRALTDTLDFPGTDPLVRARLEERVQEEGTARLHAELEERDPQAAARVSPGDSRRIVRALEVLEVTGRPFSASLPRYEDVTPTVHLALRPQREALSTCITARAEAMFASGLVEETQTLVRQGLREGPTASRAIGYVQALSVLDGRCSVEEAVADTAQATRQLASRQLKWFRRDPRVHWLDVKLTPDGEPVQAQWQRVVDRALELVQEADSRLPPEQ
ncbi:tRNA (adenosine(37)-N6)-dimethylallyltransferase MiaA [Actinomyces wuliandei]|uniref:tRNA (adenosine(37)-N6)-dimethylallyltransferase MiaA n=1 Tax=Actinomyces wuliandei TaxID=2057743 RepID=UPI0011197CA6|nr:tRNA (adenosine(37)-N6)-dimethylallyltransferase MiaA [Actinomyces wuliandei]